MKYPGVAGYHSQEHINDIRSPSSGPVKVVTTGGNVPTQPISRPVMLIPGNRSPKTKRQSAEFAAQLTGKGFSGDAPRPGQGSFKPVFHQAKIRSENSLQKVGTLTTFSRLTFSLTNHVAEFLFSLRANNFA